MKFNIIYSDPPWHYSDKAAAGERGSEFKYPVLKTEDLMNLRVDEVAADDCVLFMWSTMPQIPEALKVMEAWGFKYKTVAFVWVKTTVNGLLHFGMGNHTRANAEIVLLGIKGHPKRVNKGVHQVVMAPVGQHSRKPEEVRTRIELLMGDVPRLELFARPPVAHGWHVWGDEVEKSVEIAWERKLKKGK